MEKIAINGPDVFYTGEIAQSMIDLILADNGTMTMDDLKNYKVLVRQPLSIDYRGYKVFATDAPSSGAITLSMLKTMEQYPLSDRKDTNLTVHRFNEAMRFAYGARVELGDPNYIRNIEEYENALISASKAKEISGRIRDNETQPVEAYDPNGIYTAEGHGTSHIVAADGSGMAISSTTTLNLLFGAQIMTSDTGIIPNDQMNDFSIPNVRNAFVSGTSLLLSSPRAMTNKLTGLRPLAQQLHRRRQATLILLHPRDNRARQRHPLLHHRRGRRLAHHQRHRPDSVARRRARHEHLRRDSRAAAARPAHAEPGYLRVYV